MRYSAANLAELSKGAGRYILATPIQRVKEIKERKVVVNAELSAGGLVCARGEVVAVRMPEHMIPKMRSEDA